VPYAGLSLYAASKSALIGLTKGLARDLGERGIAVSLVHPGSNRHRPEPSQRSPVPTRSGGSPRSTGTASPTVAHLAGEGGRNITGAAITVDAGANA
jgi:3-oxoacyl-[acyl-carrier protein] reductase